MTPYRVRIRQMEFGYYAIELRHWPWSFWKEEKNWGRRTKDRDEAIRRAKSAINREIITHKQIMEAI